MTLLVLEYHQGLLTGGAVDAHAGHLQTPSGRGGADVGEVVEIGALVETLPGVGHLALDLGLVLGMALARRVRDEAPALGIFQEAPGENGMERIRTHHGGGEIVDDQILGHPTEESPRRLQTGDHVRKLLLLHGPDEAVAGVAQHDDHGPDRLALAGGRIGDHAQAAEIGLGHLSRRRVRHAHRGLAASPPVAVHDETAQRRVRHLATPHGQQLVDAGHLQAVFGDPLVDLVRPRLQQVLPGRRCRTWPHLTNRRQTAQLVLSGNRSVPGNSLGLRRRQVLPHRIPRQPGARRDPPLTVSRLPTADDLFYLHPGNLSIRHRCTSTSKCTNGRRCGSQSGLMALKIWPAYSP